MLQEARMRPLVSWYPCLPSIVGEALLLLLVLVAEECLPFLQEEYLPSLSETPEEARES